MVEGLWPMQSVWQTSIDQRWKAWWCWKRCTWKITHPFEKCKHYIAL